MAGRIAYYGNIATQGLILNLDAAIQGSYPKTGSTWFDISNNGNNGTLTNGPLYTGSDYGAIVFDGVNDRVDMVKNSLANGNSPFSVTSWVNTSRSTRELFFGLDDQSHLDLNAYNVNGSTLSFHRYNSFVMYAPTGSLITGSIQHVVWTYNGTTVDETNAKMYVNGVMKTGYQFSYNVGPFTYNIDSTQSNFISNKNPSFSSAAQYTGSIYNLQLYNQALTPFQVWQNFNAYKSRYGIPDIVTDGLVLNLDAGNPYSYLSGSSGTTWSNTVPASSSISGSLVNGTTYSNGAMVFDGVDDYVNCGNNTSLQITNNLSVFGWVKGGSQDNKDIVSKYRTTSDQRSWTFGTSLNSDGLGTNKLKVVLSSNGTFNSGFLKYYISDLVVFDNNWKYVGFVFQSNLLKLYVNGNEVSTTKIYDATVNTLYNSSADVWIGAISNPANQYTGNVANTQIYNRALSPTEITQNFNALRGRYGI